MKKSIHLLQFIGLVYEKNFVLLVFKDCYKFKHNVLPNSLINYVLIFNLRHFSEIRQKKCMYEIKAHLSV